jgi:hypothetical protein
MKPFHVPMSGSTGPTTIAPFVFGSAWHCAARSDIPQLGSGRTIGPGCGEAPGSAAAIGFPLLVTTSRITGAIRIATSIDIAVAVVESGAAARTKIVGLAFRA